ncbi:MAG: hypothetical protein K2W95_34250 [Candidatus Obscuribacterales bacterium]|nr:hypothetical protein [Candidatus Obscuribacterales bacterium]
MKEADIDFCKFLIIGAVPLSWVLLGSLVCGIWEGVGILPDHMKGTEIRGFCTEFFCLFFWCYLPLITPFGKIGDNFIVDLRKWLMSQSYNLTNLAQERTFFRLAGAGYAIYFAFRPIVHSSYEQWHGSDAIWSVGCLLWFLVSMGLSFVLHRDVPS